MRGFNHGTLASQKTKPPIIYIGNVVNNSVAFRGTVNITSPSTVSGDLLVVCLNKNDYGIPAGWTRVNNASSLYYRMATSDTFFRFATNPTNLQNRGGIMAAYRNTTGIVSLAAWPTIIPQSNSSYVGIIGQNASNAATWQCMGAPGLTQYVCTQSSGSGSQLLEVDVVQEGVATAVPNDPTSGQKFVFELIRA